jgi:hypothetical protein
MNRINKILFLVLGILISFSCKKFLDAKPNMNQAVPQTISELQALLDNSEVMNIQASASMGTASSDEYFLLDNNYNSVSTKSQNIYKWEVEKYYYSNSWSKTYTPIFISNYCLENLELIRINSQNIVDWENVKGSSLFFRSYYFLSLLWDFAKAYDNTTAKNDPGIVLRLGADFNVPSKRASVEECYNKIIEDVKISVELLPDLPVHPMRPSKAAAYGLLARTYLSMRVYDSAHKYSNLSLKLNSNLMDYNGDEGINGTIESVVPFNKFNKETIFYSELYTGDLIAILIGGKVDSVLITMYQDGDLRKKAFFRKENEYFIFKGMYTGNSFDFFSGLSTGEMYLIRSEASARMNNLENAKNDLEKLIKARWDKNYPNQEIVFENSENALKKILEERKKELVLRGLRWIDMKRLNKEQYNIAFKRKINGLEYNLLPNSEYCALPIPQDIIETSGIQQNKR